MSWDAELRLDGLKILLLLLVDNAPVHSDINSKLTHIRVEFMLRLEYRNSLEYRKIELLRFFPVFGPVSVVGLLGALGIKLKN